MRQSWSGRGLDDLQHPQGSTDDVHFKSIKAAVGRYSKYLHAELEEVIFPLDHLLGANPY